MKGVLYFIWDNEAKWLTPFQPRTLYFVWDNEAKALVPMQPAKAAAK